MMEEWFLEEFGSYGFTVTQTLYNPDTFTPCKKVIHPDGFETSVNLMSDLVDDLSGWSLKIGTPSCEWVIEEMRNLIREELYRSYPEVFERKDFTPKQNLNKFKF